VKLMYILAAAILLIMFCWILLRKQAGKRSCSDLSGQGRGNDVSAVRNQLGFLAWGLTDRGLVRQNNEDSFLIPPNSSSGDKLPSNLLCVVADGMGGKDYGEVASSTAVEVFQQKYKDICRQPLRDYDWVQWLQEVIGEANKAVIKKSNELKIKSMIGTTLVAAILSGSKAFVVNAGDSRAYLLRNGKLRQITKDHSLVSLLVEKKLIEPEELYTHPRRGEIMRFLGQSELLPDVFELDITAGDRLMLCSDGLWEMVRDPHIESILKDSLAPEETCRKLVKEANRAGGRDNITVVVINVS
jgi:protein phosphatase